jgi:hypothetical protein
VRPLLVFCSVLLLSACSGPRIVLSADAASVTSPSRPTQPPASVAQELDRPAAAPAPPPAKPATVYVCPMHPEVTSTDPAARCDKCGMRLEEKK